MPYQPCSREAADESGQGGSAALCVREGTSGTSREKRARAEGRLRDERTSLQSSRGHSTALAFQLGQGRNVGWFPQHLPASETSPLPAPRWLRGECGHFEKKYSINSSGLSIFKKVVCDKASAMSCAEHDSRKAQTADTEFERGLINSLWNKEESQLRGMQRKLELTPFQEEFFIFHAGKANKKCIHS
ncbi:uncharacterized protein LOC134546893 isoform X2 [Prinia subflava]|uniref:uncharacterized protein LOC134546893 isoform X2 n=1 Tax=Prinia subflava TaxID=208062 RepID=UPI002FE1EE40